jgi:hypothetical protein
MHCDRGNLTVEVRNGSNSEVAAVAGQVCSTPNNRHSPLERTRPFGADFVAKVG